MATAARSAPATIWIDENECKGCGLCVQACPPRVLSQSDRLNHFGYRPALYRGAGCTGCGICFLACPEPGAITVLVRPRLSSPQPGGSK